MNSISKISLVAYLSFFAINAFAAKASAQHFKKVVWIVFENTNFQAALNQPDFAKMTKYGALFTNMTALTHPSQGNYIAMIAGATLGVKNDKLINLNATHVGDLLEKAGRDWHVYAEDYPGGCFLGASSGGYARKHVPFISFLNVSQDAQRCKKIDNAENFFQDLNSDSIADFSMYIPNIKNDGHDPGVDYAGKWLNSKFGSILTSPSGLRDTLFILTFDENAGVAGNQIYTVLIGSNVIPASINKQAIDHPALLKMIEDEYRIGDLGRGDASAPTITGIWK